MEKQIMLRFRDLVTEDDGTISDHQSLINDYGEVWWGWWMKQKETPPRSLLKEISVKIKERGSIEAYLFNSGLHKLYRVFINKILLAPGDTTIGTPDPKISPTYYHRGTYPAWFLIKKIDEVKFEDCQLAYMDFPTRENVYAEYLGKKINSLKELEDQSVTMWVVHDGKI